MKGVRKSYGRAKWAGILLAMSLLLAVPPAGGTAALPSFLDAGPAPKAFNYSSEIENIIYSVSEPLMERHIQALQDFGTRYTYRGDRCYQAADYISSVFSRNGLGVYYDDFVYGSTFNYAAAVRTNVRNVVGVKPGTSGSNGTVIICGHYDSISPGTYPWTDAPGADDNGSGVAAVLAAAEILSDYEFNLTIKFIAFSGEEQGMRGSFNYRNGALASGENITAVINLDMIATNPDPGSGRVKVYWGSGTIVRPENIMGAVNETWSEYGHITGVEPYVAGTNGASDHQYFAYFFESIFFHEDIFSSVYHTVNDKLDRLNMTYCANVTQLAVATTARIAGLSGPDSNPPALAPGLPGNGTHAPALPTVSIEATDPAGINASSITFTLNGVAVSPMLTPIPLGYNISFVPLTPYSDGQSVQVNISVADTLGNAAESSWAFTVDAIPPEPPADFTIAADNLQPTKRGTALEIGAAWDSKHALAPSIIYRDGEYRMWYTASNATNRFHICYANSSDGISWTKHGIVLLYTVAGQPDYYQVGYPEVIYDGEYRMWYSANDGLNLFWRIMYANSTDGINWNRHGVVLNMGPQGSPDSVYAMAPSVLHTGEYRMWYTGYDGLKFSILYANSSDGIAWTRHGSSLISPEGPGNRWGDAYIAYPSVVHDGTEYRMWYNRVGENYFRTHSATSGDGIHWNDLGIAIEAGIDIGTRDRFQATHCSAMMNGNETKIWYSGFDGVNWRILYSNISAGDASGDLTLSWTPSADAVGYEIFRESRPSAFQRPLESGARVRSAPPAGVTPWSFETELVDNTTVYGPAAGSDPPFFSLPDDNIINITLCIRSGSGSWVKLAAGSDYALDQARGTVEIISPLFTTGCTVHAWYNHSAGRALRVTGTSVTDVGAGGASALSYYYIIRAADRAGNTAECSQTVGKIGNEVDASWNLLGNPFLEGPTPLSDALAGLDWVAARTWDPDLLPYHWTSNITGRPYGMNTLQTVDYSAGTWVKTASAGVHSPLGDVFNISMTLKAGWNLVSYPYHEYMSVSQALAGMPWDRVEAMDAASPYLLGVLDNNSILRPGQGLWVRVTSDCVWNAVNTS